MHFKKYFTYSLILLSAFTYGQEIKERHIRKLKNRRTPSLPYPNNDLAPSWNSVSLTTVRFNTIEI